MIQVLIPQFIFISLFLLIVLILLNSEHLKCFFNTISRNSWFMLLLFFFSALLIRTFISSHQHIMYIDEAWYMEAGKNLLQTGNQGDYPKSIGWPFILSIIFGIFGVNNWVAIYASLIFGSLTVFSMFFLTFIITKNQNVSLASSLLLSLFAVHIRWSTTAETSVASLFFMILSLFFCFLYYRSGLAKLFWLSLSGIAFAAQFRIENYTLPIIFIIGCVIFRRCFFKRNDVKFILPWIIFLLLVAPNFIQVLRFYLDNNWSSINSIRELNGNIFHFYNLIYNSFGTYIFNTTMFQPMLFNVLLITGFFGMLFKQIKEALFLVALFLSFWFVCLFFWFIATKVKANILSNTRFFMNLYPIIVNFAAYGIMLIKDLLFKKFKNIQENRIFLCVTVILFISFVPYTMSAANYFNDDKHKLETMLPELAERDIPVGCIIVSDWPTVLKSTTDLNVIDLESFLNNPTIKNQVFEEYECVLFLEDLMCSISGESLCRKAKSSFFTEEFKTYQKGKAKYSFYKIRQK